MELQSGREKSALDSEPGVAPVGGGQRQSSERRASRRLAWSSRAQVSWLTVGGMPARPVTVRCSDLTNGGVGLISRWFVHPGTLGIFLPLSNSADARLMCLEVRNCRYVGVWQHVLGARWVALPANIPVSIRMTDQGPMLVRNAWQGSAE